MIYRNSMTRRAGRSALLRTNRVSDRFRIPRGRKKTPTSSVSLAYHKKRKPNRNSSLRFFHKFAMLFLAAFPVLSVCQYFANCVTYSVTVLKALARPPYQVVFFFPSNQAYELLKNYKIPNHDWDTINESFRGE